MERNTITQVKSTPAAHPHQDISELAVQLRAVLLPYVFGKPTARGELLSKHGQALLRANTLLRVLCCSEEERETLICGLQIVEEVRQHLEDTISGDTAASEGRA